MKFTIAIIATFCHLNVLLAKPKHKVLVVSFDGFALHYLKSGRFLLPTFEKLQRDGVFTESIQSVFPSETFPNHFSIVTGLYPSAHGIVSNTFYDPVLKETFNKKRYGQPDRPGLLDPKFWNGEPIWQTAARLGVARTATNMWPGALVRGFNATLHRTDYTEKIPFETRVDETVRWLKDEQIDLAFLYHFEPDDTGHEAGTEGPQMIATLQQADWYLNYLLKALERAGFNEHNFNFILCSDHGMWNIGREAFLEDILPGAGNMSLWFDRVSRYGAHADLWPIRGKEQEIYERLVAASFEPRYNGAFTVYRKGQLPKRFYYDNNPRIAPLIALAVPGSHVTPTRKMSGRRSGMVGDHGTDPADYRMRPIFMARGPAFRRNFNATALTPLMTNKDIHAVVAALIGLTNGPPTNASFANVAGLFRNNNDGADILAA